MYEYEREELVDKIKKKGIKDEKVLDAFRKVERHEFVPDAMKHHSYKDNALPIGYGQTISQPFTVGYMTQALNVKEGDKVLEIGTGSGFQAAILDAMGVKVYTIERNMELYNRTLKLFDRLNIRAAARCGDGTLGWSEYAPYNGIVVTAGGPSVPESLKKQLAIGGRLVIPVGTKKEQRLEIITRDDEDNYTTVSTPNFAFVPLIGKQGWNKE